MTRTHSRLLLAAVLLALFGPLLARGEVVYPSDNTLELGLSADEAIGRPSNRNLGDVSQSFLPALHHQLRGNSSGWIAGWDPHNELGHPAVQACGLGKAFFLTHLFSWFSADAYRVYTWLALAAVSLTCLFGLLLFESLGLHPAACLMGALGLGLGSLSTVSITFVLFHWGVCWSTALLWATTVFVRRPTALRALAIAFFVHALLLSAYPQRIVWQAYVLTGHALCLCARHRSGWRPRLALVAQIGACALVGVVSAVPTYLDLLQVAAGSSRLGIDHEFLAKVLQSFETLGDLGLFVANLFDPFLFGNPMAQERAADGNTLALTPLLSGLACASLALGQWRRLWPVFGFILVTFVLTLWERGFGFAASYLGLGFSRTAPWSQAFAPLVILGAFAADHALRAPSAGRWRGPLLALAMSLAGFAGALCTEFELERSYAALAGVLALGTSVFLYTRRAGLLVVLSVASALLYGWPLRTNRGLDEIRFDSPIVAYLRTQTASGTRYAWIGDAPWESTRTRNTVLGPNREGFYDLRSIHTYNPLSSRLYQRWATNFAGPQVDRSHGRRFSRVMNPRWRSGLGFSGVEILLSRQRLEPGKADFLLEFDGIFVHRLPIETKLQRQVTSWERTDGGSLRLAPAEQAGRGLVVERLLDEDEHLRFRTTTLERETLLAISQQHHAGWRAWSAGRALETVLVDEFYQGVLLPPGTSEVELEYRSPIRWSWIPQAAFGLAGALLGLAALRRRRA